MTSLYYWHPDMVKHISEIHSKDYIMRCEPKFMSMQPIPETYAGMRQVALIKSTCGMASH